MGSDEDANDTESNDDESNDKDNAESNNNKPSDSAATTDLGGNEPGNDQGVRRLRHRGKGVIKKYAKWQRGKQRGEDRAGLSFVKDASSSQRTI